MIGLPKQVAGALRRHPAALLTIAYLAISLIGLFFSWAYFRRFGVNYFLFADVTDFLLAAVREPYALLAGAGGVAFIFLIYRYAEWELARLERRPEKGKILRGYIAGNRWALTSPWFTLLLVVIYVYAMVSYYATWRAGEIRHGGGTEVELRLDGADAVPLRLMGSSARFVFLYDPPTERTIIVPDESITSIAIRRPDAPPEGDP